MGNTMTAARTAFALAAALACAFIGPVQGAEKLRVGKAVPEAFSFVPLKVAAVTG